MGDNVNNNIKIGIKDIILNNIILGLAFSNLTIFITRLIPIAISAFWGQPYLNSTSKLIYLDIIIYPIIIYQFIRVFKISKNRAQNFYSLMFPILMIFCQVVYLLSPLNGNNSIYTIGISLGILINISILMIKIKKVTSLSIR